MRCLMFLCVFFAHLFNSAPPVQAQVQPDSMAGCYVIEVGEWSGPFPSGWPEIHQPPDTVRLGLERAWPELPATAMRTERALSPHLPELVRHGRESRFPPFWEVGTADSLILAWSTGLAGVVLRLAGTTDLLSGTARAFHDVRGVVQPTAPASAKRVPCR